ncbi:MAG: CaiB/BaiF CoA-transferase family protein [Proteobacteria bacterium]|nr:CaiB/BaiF CoA-transferase family protein [Pseudomonadota bacterium]
MTVIDQRPLAGIKVIDLTHALAGPLATFHLGLMGAEVIKIETPGKGDEFRDYRATVFSQANAGKRSVTLDLKQAQGRDILHRLIAGADVAIENFRPGVAAGLGLDWATLQDINPQLIYCSISGYGQSGDLAERPAMEWSVQAMAGMTDLYLAEEAEPHTLGLSVLDPFAGYMAYAAILAALLQRQKTQRGQRLDVAMFDAAFVLNAACVVDAMAGAVPVPLTKRANVARFMAKDRRLFISFVWPKWFRALCDVLEAPELLADPRFVDNRAMQANGEALLEEIERRLARKTAAEWAKALALRGVPASPVCSLAEAAAWPQVRDRGLLSTIRLGNGDDTAPLEVVGAGVVFEHNPPRAPGPVPTLGEATTQTLLDLGYQVDEIDELRRNGVI